MSKRIGFISDLHIDTNEELHITENLIGFAEYEELDYIVIAGDIASSYRKVMGFFRDFETMSKCKLKWVPGNHDLYCTDGKTSDEIYRLYFYMKENLASHPLILNDYVIIGDTGWYDYSFRKKEVFSIEKCRDKYYGMAAWADGTHFKWKDFYDEEITQIFLESIKKQIIALEDKKVITCTHTVPYKRFAEYRGYNEWDYFTAFIGSEKMGELYDGFKRVETVVFGHTHNRYYGRFNGKEIICCPLGYSFNEWVTKPKDAFTEIKMCMKIKEID